MVVMYHHKKSNGGLDYIGYDTDKKVYSNDYYANVGIMNAEQSKHTTLQGIKILTKMCIDNGYTKVTYLPRQER